MHERQGYPPNRTPKTEGPDRSKEERLRLAKERAQAACAPGIAALTPPPPPPAKREAPHSQSKLGNKLTKKAKTRIAHDEAGAEQDDKCVFSTLKAQQGCK